MIDPGGTAEYRTLLRGPHTPLVRVEVWRGDTQLDDRLPINGGRVEASLTSQITRRGTISVDRALYPADESGLLAPFGNSLRIYRGVRGGGGREFWFPVFRGLITGVSRKPRQPAVVTFSDRAAEVDEAEFEVPEESRPDRSIIDEIMRLIREGVPGAEFGQHDPIAVRAAPQTWERDRAGACDDLAAAGGAFWYAQADGLYVVRRVPWAWHPDVAADGTVSPVAEFYDAPSGLNSLGPDATIDTTEESMTRDPVYNSVVATADQGDGGAPLREVVRETNPMSPTHYGGEFGRRVTHVDVPAAATAAAVRAAGTTYLRRSRAASDAAAWSMVPDPSLELGDVLGLTTDGRRRVQVLAEFTMPLTPEGSMACAGRSLVLPSGVIARARR